MTPFATFVFFYDVSRRPGSTVIPANCGLPLVDRMEVEGRGRRAVGLSWLVKIRRQCGTSKGSHKLGASVDVPSVFWFCKLWTLLPLSCLMQNWCAPERKRRGSWESDQHPFDSGGLLCRLQNDLGNHAEGGERHQDVKLVFFIRSIETLPFCFAQCAHRSQTTKAA